jgi:methylated-DNA-[protein]-cysteine S-methyltransferase
LTSDGAALTRLYMNTESVDLADWRRDDEAAPFPEARRQLAAYFAGDLREFDLPLSAGGTPFQRQVWDALMKIPYGETVSYGELARGLGNPGAARAVGLANGNNPIGIIVPCHRVIGANGKLVGYAGGMPNKQALLALEAGARGDATGSLF